MKKIRLIVKTKSKKYPIIIGPNIINNIASLLKSNNISFEKSLIIYDTKFPSRIFQINITQKSLNLIQHLQQPERL